MNNAFAYDLVPSPSVIIAALKAARRVNDFPTAVRVFEGVYSSSHLLVRNNLNKTSIPVSERLKLTRHTLFTGIKAKVENQGQYDEYIRELESIRQELGIELKEVLYPESS